MVIFGNTTAFFNAYSQSDAFGKIIFFGLLFLSIMSWIVLLHKAYVTRHVRRFCRQFEAATLEQHHQLLSIEMNRLPQPLSANLPNPFQEVLISMRKKAVQLLDKNMYFAEERKEGGAPYLTTDDLQLLESHVLTTVSGQSRLLEKNLHILSMITTLAPFLGLLGTVWGILITFSGMNGAQATSNAVVLAGLSTALSTTVMGLLIAIPALVGYTMLKNGLRHLSSEMEEYLYKLISHLELQYRRTR